MEAYNLSPHSRSFFVAEYCPHGDLMDVVMKVGRLPQPITRSLFKELLDGVAFIHDNNIVHRDIKPDNLLLDDNY